MSKLSNAYGSAKAYAITGFLTASTMVPAFADDFDTTSILTKITAAGAAVATVCAAIAVIVIVKRGWNLITGK